MKRPSFQWYPADYANNAKLRRCSWGAKGVWTMLLGLLHDSDEYGLLDWPLKDIAQALGCPMPLLRELVAKNVLKGCERGTCEPYIYRPRHGRVDGAPVILIDARSGPIWFSSRLVRDEYIRKVRGAANHFEPEDTPKTPPKPPPNDAPNPPIGEGQGDGSTVSSSSSNTKVLASADVEAVDNSHHSDKSEKVKTDRKQWWKTDEGVMAQGAALRVNANPGESMHDYKQRLFAISFTVTRERTA